MRLLNPRWRKIIRDMWSYKFRTVLVVLSIAVGIFAVGVVNGSQQVFLTALNKSYAATNPASGTVMMLDEFDDDLVAAIKSLREVETAEGRREITLRYKLKPADDWREMSLIAAENFAKLETNKIWPQAGDWPPPDKKLVIERTSLAIMGATIGDKVIVETRGGKERLMEIAGTAHDQSGAPASMTQQVNAYINRNTLAWLGESRDYNRLYFIAAQDKTNKAHLEVVGDVVRRKVENSNLTVMFVQISNPNEHPLNDVLKPLLLVLTTMGGLALVLSGFLVVNIISAVLAQQTRQIGIMKAIGAHRQQIMTLYFVMVLIYGALSLLVALPLGVAGAWGFSLFMANFFNFDLGDFFFPISVLAVQIAIGLLVPLLVAVYPIINGTRLTIREALYEYSLGKGKFGTNFIDRILQRLRGLSRPLMISLRNTFRRKTRLALTLTTLTLAGATFITIFSVRASLLGTLDENMKYWNFDMMVMFDKEYRLDQIARATARMPAVVAAESWGSGSAIRLRPDGQEGDSTSLSAPPADTRLLKVKLTAGRWLTPADTNALVVNTDFLDNEPDLRVGDEVVLKIGSRKTRWQIVGVVEGTMMGATVYANYDYYARLTDAVNKAQSVQLKTSLPAASLNDRQVIQAFEDQFKQAGLSVSMIRAIQEIRAMMETAFNFLSSFLLVMAVLLAIVGGLGLSGTMSINVLERVREIGIMRSIGASDWAILRLVMIEGLIIGLLSWLIGAVLALPLSKVISDQIGLLMLDKPLDFTYSLNGVLLWLVIAGCLAVIASFLPARNASRLTVWEILAYE